MSREEETSGDDVGSLAEETMRLLGAVLGPAAEAGGAGFDPQMWAGLSDRAARAAHELNDHIATGGEDCRYCPVCRAIQVVRGTSPEVKEQLASAAASLLQAAAGALASAPDLKDRHDEERRRARDVEHIDLDEA